MNSWTIYPSLVPDASHALIANPEKNNANVMKMQNCHEKKSGLSLIRKAWKRLKRKT